MQTPVVTEIHRHGQPFVIGAAQARIGRPEPRVSQEQRPEATESASSQARGTGPRGAFAL